MAAPPQDIFVEDDDPSHVSYAPEGAWTPVGGRPKLYRSGSYHQTDVSGARATFSFTGTFVAYYSDYNTDHGNFTVSLDGAPVATLSSHSTVLISKQLLFSAFVPPGAHALTVTNDAQGGVVGVDYFVYHASPPASTGSTTSATASASATATTGSGGGLAPAAATDVALGATAGAALLVLGALALRLRLRRRRAREVRAVLASC